MRNSNNNSGHFVYYLIAAVLTVSLVGFSLFSTISSILSENNALARDISKTLHAHIDSEALEDEREKREEYMKKIKSETAADQTAAKSVSSINNAPHLDIDPSKCTHEALWGREHGGGWTICLDNIPPEKCVVYSYGLGADWSFDNSAEGANCEVHGFDPTGLLWRQGMHGSAYANINYAEQYPSKLKHFHNFGLGAADRAVYPLGSVPQDWPGLGDPQLSKSNPEPWEMRSIERTMSDLGHMETGLTILKIDVEGAEWDALAAFLSSERMKALVKEGKFRQLLLEWHWDPDSRAKNNRHAAIMKTFETLGFVPWKVVRHVGSDCCLDVSYIWAPSGQRRLRSAR